jgi:hypothetical protein
MCCMKTVPYYVSSSPNPSTPVNIGPINGGTLHSLVVSHLGNTNTNTGGSMTLMDNGVTILQCSFSANAQGTDQYRWNGLKISGQLSVVTFGAVSGITIEMEE